VVASLELETLEAVRNLEREMKRKKNIRLAFLLLERYRCGEAYRLLKNRAFSGRLVLKGSFR
jgi:hypothetical protein